MASRRESERGIKSGATAESISCHVDVTDVMSLRMDVSAMSRQRVTDKAM
jgi:hypothetical protein